MNMSRFCSTSIVAPFFCAPCGIICELVRSNVSFTVRTAATGKWWCSCGCSIAYRKQKLKEFVKFLVTVAHMKKIGAVVAKEGVFETVFDWETTRLFTKWSLYMRSNHLKAREIITRLSEIIILFVTSKWKQKERKTKTQYTRKNW